MKKLRTVLIAAAIAGTGLLPTQNAGAWWGFSPWNWGGPWGGPWGGYPYYAAPYYGYPYYGGYPYWGGVPAYGVYPAYPYSGRAPASSNNTKQD